MKHKKYKDYKGYGHVPQFFQKKSFIEMRCLTSWRTYEGGIREHKQEGPWTLTHFLLPGAESLCASEVDDKTCA